MVKLLPDVALPVTLDKFTATLTNTGVACTWQTLQEVNLDHFEIERSVDAINYIVAGKVKATGDSHQSLTYSFSDRVLDNFPIGKIYYRLRNIDKDGSSTYSNVASVVYNKLLSIVVSPNPAREYLNVTLNSPEQKVTIRILNISGATVIKKTAHLFNGINTVQINLVNLAAGKYFMAVEGISWGKRASFLKK